ncbi:hypothetical protein I5L01_15670, partial [Erythrobacter sp. YJ-T3-07]|uniref:hypothetical protein n=1 Tax=Erythrobacter sp. YJ-T3-07 TaxID=2793063 RepID=UPI0018D3B545
MVAERFVLAAHLNQCLSHVLTCADIKITKDRIYALTFHPIQEKPIIIAGDKTGIMGVFDASQEKPVYDDDDEDQEIPLPIVSAFTTHARTISSILVPDFDHNSIFTASYDSTI